MRSEKLSPFEIKMLAAIREVFGWQDRPSLEARHQPVNPALMDWIAFTDKNGKDYPKGSWILLETPFLRPDQIAQMQGELKVAVEKELEARGVARGKHEFFPPLIGKDYYSRHPRVLINWKSVQFLMAKEIKVDLDPIFEKYHQVQVKYSDDLKALRDRINVASGYPVWRFFDYAESGQEPFVSLTVPEGTEGAVWSWLPYNSGAQLCSFIEENNLQSVMRYDERTHRDGADADLTIEAENLPALQKVVEQVEATGDAFRDAIAGMLLRATPRYVIHSLSYDDCLQALMGMGSGTLGEVQEAFSQGPSVQDLSKLNDVADCFITTQAMIDYLADNANKGKELPALLLKKTASCMPALAPYIESKTDFAAVRPIANSRRDSFPQPT